MVLRLSGKQTQIYSCLRVRYRRTRVCAHAIELTSLSVEMGDSNRTESKDLCLFTTCHIFHGFLFILVFLLLVIPLRVHQKYSLVFSLHLFCSTKPRQKIQKCTREYREWNEGKIFRSKVKHFHFNMGPYIK